MSISKIYKRVIVLAIAMLSGLSLADDGAAVRTMAGILSHLQHYPSVEEKAVLVDIQQDASNSEAVHSIAKALHDMQHLVSDSDKAKLEDIATSDADDDVKALANILAGIKHFPSAEAKARLEALQK